MVGKSNMQFHDLSLVRGTIPALNRWGLYINRGIWDTFIRCWAAGFSRLLHPVFLSFVLFSKAVPGLFLLKCHPNRIGVFRIFLLLVLLLPRFHSVFLYMLFCCCTHSLIHSFGVVTVKDAFTVESVVRILFLCLDVQHTSGGSTSRRPYRNVA